MRLRINSFVTCCILLFSQQIFAAELQIKNYSQLQHHLESGCHVRAIVDFNKCTVTPVNFDELYGNAFGGFSFDQFLKYQFRDREGNIKEMIATSTNMLVTHPKYGHVYNYVRLRIQPDNTAEIHAEIIDPKTFVSLGQKTYQCAINNGEDKSGLSLYLK